MKYVFRLAHRLNQRTRADKSNVNYSLILRYVDLFSIGWRHFRILRLLTGERFIASVTFVYPVFSVIPCRKLIRIFSTSRVFYAQSICTSLLLGRMSTYREFLHRNYLQMADTVIDGITFVIGYRRGLQPTALDRIRPVKLVNVLNIIY